MPRKDVKEALAMCREVGLDPVFDRGQYKVYDPTSGALLFNIHQTPSDPNWLWNIRRHLRSTGFLDVKLHTFRVGGKGHKKKPVIDLVALRKAQAAAYAAGERVPTLDDLEDSTEFFTRTKGTLQLAHFTTEAQEEAINGMAVTDAPRINACRQRLRKFFEENDVTQIEFARRAVEVGPRRNLRTFTNAQMGSQSISRFVNGDALRMWGIDIIEATLDTYAGLRYGEIDESILKEATEPQPVTPEEDLAAHGELEEEIATSLTNLREQYAETLMVMLRNAVSEGYNNAEELIPLLERLDKLVGLEV